MSFNESRTSARGANDNMQSIKSNDLTNHSHGDSAYDGRNVRSNRKVAGVDNDSIDTIERSRN